MDDGSFVRSVVKRNDGVNAMSVVNFLLHNGLSDMVHVVVLN